MNQVERIMRAQEKRIHELYAENEKYEQVINTLRIMFTLDNGMALQDDSCKGISLRYLAVLNQLNEENDND